MIDIDGPIHERRRFGGSIAPRTAIRRSLAAITCAGLLLTAAGCGGSAPPTTSKPKTQPTTTTPAQPIHATLLGENHNPVVNRRWHYTVTVTDAQGHKLSGTETTQYTFNGAVVGTEKPSNVAFTDGVYRDTIEFPAAAVGYPLDVQTVIHTSHGSVTLDWPVEVKR